MPIGVFTHNHTQTEPAAEWNVVHNLGTLVPCVDVFIDYNGERTKILPKDVIAVDKATVKVLFTAPRTGSVAVR